MTHYSCAGSCRENSGEEGICTSEGCDRQYELLEACACEDGKHGRGESQASGEAVTKDSNGTALQNGDDVHLIKDLPLRGSSLVYKRGTVAKGIRLTGNPEEVECRFGKTTIVLRTEFLKKKG